MVGGLVSQWMKEGNGWRAGQSWMKEGNGWRAGQSMGEGREWLEGWSVNG